jgi:hypothetical protein
MTRGTFANKLLRSQIYRHNRLIVLGGSWVSDGRYIFVEMFELFTLEPTYRPYRHAKNEKKGVADVFLENMVNVTQIGPNFFGVFVGR